MAVRREIILEFINNKKTKKKISVILIGRGKFELILQKKKKPAWKNKHRVLFHQKRRVNDMPLKAHKN